MQLHSNYLSSIARISSSIILESFPAYFCCNKNFNLSHNSLGSEDKKIVFDKDFFLWDDETTEEKTIPGD